MCERVAAGLFEAGVREGTRVSWQLPTRIDTVLLSVALSRLGAVQNPIIALYREREPYYRQAHLTIDTGGIGLDQVVRRTLSTLRRMHAVRA